MGSKAFHEWRGARAARIDELIEAHATVGGEGPGRRWRTEAINEALVIRVAGEWQGYLVDLHDQVSDWIVSRVGKDSAPGAKLLQSFLTKDRELQRGNPTTEKVQGDFNRFGFSVWKRCQERDMRTEGRLEKVNFLMRARNGIAHANQAQLAQLEAQHSIRIVLRTVKSWRSAVDALSVTLDACLSEHLGREFNSDNPW